MTEGKAKADDILKEVPGTLVEEFNVIPAFTVDLPEAAIGALAQNPNVRYVSPDAGVQILPGLDDKAAKVEKPAKPAKDAKGNSGRARQPHATSLATTYPQDTGAASIWEGARGATGAGVTVAVIDSGVDAIHPDLSGQLIAINTNPRARSAGDGHGHGTHVAGVIAGSDSSGKYIGVAPNATVISVKVSDDSGSATEADLLRGLDWVAKYGSHYHIRALNLSVSTSIPSGYATSPIDAAVERLWNDGVTVVTAAGNLGNAEDAVWYAPGNDPRVITVGCLDENQTSALADDSLCSISSRGTTEDGFAKPDLIAPGRKIYSTLGSGLNGAMPTLQAQFPDHVAPDGRHIRLSGTSMSAPMVTGAIALLLEQYPALTPDRLKQLLVGSARSYPGQTDRAGLLDIRAALASAAHPPTVPQRGIVAADGTPAPSGSVTVLWDGDTWADAYWISGHWNSSHWDSSHWDGAYWDSSHWDSAYWDSSHWDSAHWDSSHWDSSRWGSSHWDNSTTLD